MDLADINLGLAGFARALVALIFKRRYDNGAPFLAAFVDRNICSK
jgi:hypothetical protein